MMRTTKLGTLLALLLSSMMALAAWGGAPAAHAQVPEPIQIANINRPTIKLAEGHMWLLKGADVISAALDIDSVLLNANGTLLTIVFNHSGFELGVPTVRDACGPTTKGPGGGQYIEIIIGDNRTITDTRITTVPRVTVPIKPGKNIVRAYLCYDDGECVKDDDAFVAIEYDPAKPTVWDDLKKRQPRPMILTFNLPRRSDRLRMTQVDFFASGFNPDSNHVRVGVYNVGDADSIYRTAGTIDAWAPYDLYLLEPRGTYYVVRLEVLGKDGETVINTPLTTVERIVCVARE